MSNVEEDLTKFKLQLGPEWQKLHTAKWRRPKWIKFPRSMLEDARWLWLSPQAAKAWMSILVIASESDNLELPAPDLLFIRLRSTGDLQKRTTFAALIDELIQCRFLLKTTPELQSYRVPEIQIRKDKRQSPAREASQGFASPAQPNGLANGCPIIGDGEFIPPPIAKPKYRLDKPRPGALVPTSEVMEILGIVPPAAPSPTTAPTNFTYEQAMARGFGPPTPRFEKTRRNAWKLG